MSEQRPTKQVIVMRKDLNMRKGKMIAQAAHASTAWVTRRLHDGPGVNDLWLGEHEWSWLESSFKKICVYVNSEEELMLIHDAAMGPDVPSRERVASFLVTDAGLTEFHGVPTKTCLALGPDYEDKIDLITGENGPLGKLPLL